MKPPSSEKFRKRVILLQHRVRLVAVRIVLPVFLIWVLLLWLEMELAHLPSGHGPAPHHITSSVVNKGLIMLQVVPCRISSIARRGGT